MSERRQAWKKNPDSSNREQLRRLSIFSASRYRKKAYCRTFLFEVPLVLGILVNPLLKNGRGITRSINWHVDWWLIPIHHWSNDLINPSTSKSGRFQLSLQPHRKCSITQYKELGFFSLLKLGERTLWTWEWKKKKHLAFLSQNIELLYLFSKEPASGSLLLLRWMQFFVFQEERALVQFLDALSCRKVEKRHDLAVYESPIWHDAFLVVPGLYEKRHSVTSMRNDRELRWYR